MICTKCKIDKEETQYQKYWHSTQNKFRIRKECTECLYKQRKERKRLKRIENSNLIQIPIPIEIVQPVVPELEPEVSIDYSTQEGYRLCPQCAKWKYKDQYYTNRHNKKGEARIWGRCKPCQNIFDKEKAKQRMADNDGPVQVLQKPNSYVNDYQRGRTFQIMEAIGWKFNEEKGIWWKDGIKTPDGVFMNIKKYIKPSVSYVREGDKVRHPAFQYREEIYDLRSKGYSLLYIAREYDTSAPTIKKIIDIYKLTLNG